MGDPDEIVVRTIKQFLEGMAIGFEREVGHRSYTGVEVGELVRTIARSINAETLRDYRAARKSDPG